MLLITFKPSQVINSFPMWELSPQSRAEQWVASVVTAQESRVEWGEAGWDQRRINTAECSLQRGQPASAHLYCPEHTQSASTPAAQSVQQCQEGICGYFLIASPGVQLCCLAPHLCDLSELSSVMSTSWLTTHSLSTLADITMLSYQDHNERAVIVLSSDICY